VFHNNKQTYPLRPRVYLHVKKSNTSLQRYESMALILILNIEENNNGNKLHKKIIKQ